MRIHILCTDAVCQKFEGVERLFGYASIGRESAVFAEFQVGSFVLEVDMIKFILASLVPVAGIVLVQAYC